MALSWNIYKNNYGIINIENMFAEGIYNKDTYGYKEALHFIRQVVDKQPITSRQVAAVVLTFAKNIYYKEI